MFLDLLQRSHWGIPLLALLLSGVFCSVALPWVIHLAVARGWLDRPELRRAHLRPVPRLGGVAIVASCAMALLVVRILLEGVGLASEWSRSMPAYLPSLLLGAAAIFSIGVADDLRGVSPRTKLMVQLAATVFVLRGGAIPETVAFAPGFASFAPGTVAVSLVAALWIVGVTNAFNLTDGIDGLAGTMALLAVSSCLAASILGGHIQSTATVLLLLAGALIAFLRANWSPARIFLGDSGSMTLGFVLAVTSLTASTDANGVLYPIIPLAALAYPVLDTLIAVARRSLRGQSIATADSRHIHHQLCAMGWQAPQVVVFLAALFSAVSILGLAIVFAPSSSTALWAWGGNLGCLGLLVYGVRWLGYQEFVEVGQAMASVVRHARQIVREKIHANDVAQQIKSAHSIEEVRALLAQLADGTSLLDVEMVPLEDHPRRYGPPSQQISPVDALPVRVDYPLAGWLADGQGEMVLRLWARRPDRFHPPIAERLIAHVGPALDCWLHDREEQLKTRPHRAAEG